MANPNVDVQLANPPPNSVLAGPDPVQSLFTLIAARLSASIQGSYMPYVTGSATPAVDDQDKIWARVDNSGRPIGLYFYFNGNWRRVYSNAIGDLKFFQGDPTDAINGFDSTGLGVLGGMNDGWALCLTGDAEVVLADGSTKTIREIVEGKLCVNVKCYDEVSGLWREQSIDGWFKNEFHEQDFLRIRFNAGRQNFKTRSITATKDHPFLTPAGWKLARDLTTGDSVFSYERALTHTGRQAFLGMWLGDGSVDRVNGKFTVTHGEPQKAYADFVANQLGITLYEGISGKGWSEGKSNYRYSTCIRDIYPEFFDLLDENKKVTTRLLRQMGPAALAYWYMDDGNLGLDKRYPDYFVANLHTEGFTDEERSEIEEYFRSCYGWSGKYYEAAPERPHHKRWRFDIPSSLQFLSVIAPFIIESMRYKLPVELRAMPTVVKEFPLMTQGLVKRTVQIREYGKLCKTQRYRCDRSARYDIRVPGFHNFVANGFVVHNCNGKNGTLDLSNYFIAGANMNASGGGSQFDTAAAAWLSYVNQLAVKDHGDETNKAGQAQLLLRNTDLTTIRVILQGFADLSASNATKRAIVTGNYDVNNPHSQTLGVFGSNPTPLSTDPDTTAVPQTSVQTTPRWYAAAICRFVGY